MFNILNNLKLGDKNMSVLIYQIGRLEKGMEPINFNIKKNLEDEEGIKIKSVLSSFALKKYMLEYEEKKQVKVILAFPVSIPFNRNLVEKRISNKNIEEKNVIDKNIIDKNLINKNMANKNMPNDESGLPEELREKIKEIIEDEKEREKYFDNPKDFFSFHPHTKEADDFIVLHSIGKFSGIDFDTDITDIILEIFLDMIKRVNQLENIKLERKDLNIDDSSNLEKNIQDNKVNIFIDISSGHNIYVSALIEAARNLSNYYNLLHYFDSNKIQVNLLFSDPVFSKEETYDIHKSYIMEQNISFSSPLNSDQIKQKKIASDIYKEKIHEIDINNLLSDRYFYLNDEQDLGNLKDEKKKNLDISTKEFFVSQRKKEINFLLEKFGILFSALKNGIPLSLFSFSMPDEKIVFNCINDIVTTGSLFLSKNYLNSNQINYQSYIKVLSSLALMISIIKMLNEKNIHKDEEVSYSKLIELFVDKKTTIFNILKNEYARLLISNELLTYKKPNKYADNKSVFERTNNHWQILDKSMPFRNDYKNDTKHNDINSNNSDKNSDKDIVKNKKTLENINPRHFLAHAGFERNIVEVKKEGKELYFRYRKDALDRVKSILLDEI